MPGLSSIRCTRRLSAVPRAAVRAVAGEQARAGRRANSASTSSTRTTRFRMRRPPCCAGRCCEAQLPCAAGRDHAARHGHHAGRQRSVVLGDRRVFDRAVGRRDRGVRAACAMRPAASSTCDARSWSSRISSTAASTGALPFRDLRSRFVGERRGQGRDPRLEFPAGQTHRRGDGCVRAHRAAAPGPPAAGRRRPRVRVGPPARPRARRVAPGRCGRRAGGGDSAALGRGPVPAAFGTGELRPGRARGDGVRGAGRGVERGRTAGGDRAGT